MRVDLNILLILFLIISPTTRAAAIHDAAFQSFGVHTCPRSITAFYELQLLPDASVIAYDSCNGSGRQ